MKKFIFGCMLMLCGTIGGTGWLIAGASLSVYNSLPSLLNVLSAMDDGGGDGYIVIIFYAIALAGGILAACSLGENKEKTVK